MCVSCAWPKPANYSAFEFCENGAKATMWELTSARCTPEFWHDDAHTVTALREWKDHDLEMTGRLTHPLRYDAATDRYRGGELGRGVRRDRRRAASRCREESAVFYASGHAGLEASYLYALLARAYGNNNLPQSSNMCHETTSVGLTKVIGSPVGTIVWDDLAETDAFFFFGQNPGTNSPRFLHPLKDSEGSRRQDRHLQSGDRAGPGLVRRSAKPDRHADRQGDQDLRPISPAQGRRRRRRDPRPVQMRGRGRRCGQGGGQGRGDRPRFRQAAHDRLRRLHPVVPRHRAGPRSSRNRA